MVSTVARSRSTQRHRASASKLRSGMVITAPPWVKVASATMLAVPCIRGEAASWRVTRLLS